MTTTCDVTKIEWTYRTTTKKADGPTVQLRKKAAGLTEQLVTSQKVDGPTVQLALGGGYQTTTHPVTSRAGLSYGVYIPYLSLIRLIKLTIFY